MDETPYLILTEVSGFAYYAKVVAKVNYPIDYEWQGLRNNATEFEDEGFAKEISENMISKTPLQVIPKH